MLARHVVFLAYTLSVLFHVFISMLFLLYALTKKEAGSAKV
jgi:hypothetical protein